MSMTQGGEEAYLIVNADDYGCFACVSRGILRAAARGIVTATGVFANAPHFDERAAVLGSCDTLDVGVHLNLTEGFPLTSELRSTLARSSGRFPGKFAMAVSILRGGVKVADVKREWAAQIERCLANGLQVRFLNSHEHIHMLPALFRVTGELAREYRISHVRFPTARLDASPSGGSLFRGAVIGALGALNRRHAGGARTQFLGLEASGRLDLDYLARTLPRLRRGQIYELMCHPGEFDAQEVTDARLRRYHDWEGELRTLTSPDARALLNRHRVRPIGYRHLEIRAARLAVRPEALVTA